MRRSLRGALVSATALTAIAIAYSAQPVIAAEANEQLYDFNIPAQDLGTALNSFARASRQQVTFDPAAVRGKQSAPLTGRFSARAGIEKLLGSSGLTVRVGQSGVFIVQSVSGAAMDNSAPSAGARGQETTLSEIIVTAQKREERISDVPIAITALTSEGLDARKIEGGSELLRAIPNVNFSKSNFSMYNFSIRGVGTK
ncbi:MAG TPA: TonB-dependent receptor, partial [Pedomonas sp.]